MDIVQFIYKNEDNEYRKKEEEEEEKKKLRTLISKTRDILFSHRYFVIDHNYPSANHFVCDHIRMEDEKCLIDARFGLEYRKIIVLPETERDILLALVPDRIYKYKVVCKYIFGRKIINPGRLKIKDTEIPHVISIDDKTFRDCNPIRKYFVSAASRSTIMMCRYYEERKIVKVLWACEVVLPNPCNMYIYLDMAYEDCMFKLNGSRKQYYSQSQLSDPFTIMEYELAHNLVASIRIFGTDSQDTSSIYYKKRRDFEKRYFYLDYYRAGSLHGRIYVKHIKTYSNSPIYNLSARVLKNLDIANIVSTHTK